LNNATKAGGNAGFFVGASLRRPMARRSDQPHLSLDGAADLTASFRGIAER
jgi:hypothetical protein